MGLINYRIGAVINSKEFRRIAGLGWRLRIERFIAPLNNNGSVFLNFVLAYEQRRISPLNFTS